MIGRVLPHPYNFTPLIAVALLSSYAFPNRLLAVITPLFGFLLSDVIINNFIYTGYYPDFIIFNSGMIWTYGAVLIVAIFGSLFLIINSCSEEDPLPVNPGIATLISPFNQETCFDGVSINDTQSNVEFSWAAASGAISYEILISNLLTQSTQTYTANTNKTTIALTKAEPYSWYVKSIGENGSTPSQSDLWRFYLAGESTINYAPFPSELISPRSGANVTPDINNQIILNWSCSDVDGDLEQFLSLIHI